MKYFLLSRNDSKLLETGWFPEVFEAKYSALDAFSYNFILHAFLQYYLEVKQ